jgi:hypothetical protein
MPIVRIGPAPKSTTLSPSCERLSRIGDQEHDPAERGRTGDSGWRRWSSATIAIVMQNRREDT